MQILASGGGPGNIADFSVATNVFNIRYGVSGITYSSGNAQAAFATAAGNCGILIVPKQYGRWALEASVVSITGAGRIGMRLAETLAAASTGTAGVAGDVVYQQDGQKRNFGGAAAYGASFTAGDKITLLWNAEDGEVSFAKNGSNQGVAYSGIPGAYFPLFGDADVTWLISSTLTYTFSGYTQWR